MNIDLENWMGALGPEKQTAPFTSIAIPGSHDSMTYSITKQSPIAPDAEPIVQRLIKYFGFIVRPIVYSWCITQNCTILEQLILGIRYFDFRLATKAGSDDFYFVHGLYGDEVSSAFEDILQFLSEHRNEVVILDMQHFYRFSAEDHMKYIELLRNIFGNVACPAPRHPDAVTLQYLRRNGFQVIIIYRDNSALNIEELWKSGMWPTPWPQTMSPSELLKFLDSRLQSRPKDRGFVSQCVLTPTNYTVLRNPFSNVMNKCAVPAQRITIPWLRNQEIGTVNVAISDFVNMNRADFPKTVLSLNFKQK